MYVNARIDQGCINACKYKSTLIMNVVLTSHEYGETQKLLSDITSLSDCYPKRNRKPPDWLIY